MENNSVLIKMVQITLFEPSFKLSPLACYSPQNNLAGLCTTMIHQRIPDTYGIWGKSAKLPTMDRHFCPADSTSEDHKAAF